MRRKACKADTRTSIEFFLFLAHLTNTALSLVKPMLPMAFNDTVTRSFLLESEQSLPKLAETNELKSSYEIKH